MQILAHLKHVLADCEKQERKKEIYDNIEDSRGRAFWSKNFLKESKVPFRRFIPYFADFMGFPLPKGPVAAVLKECNEQTRPLLCLREVVKDNEENVSTKQFGRRVTIGLVFLCR